MVLDEVPLETLLEPLMEEDEENSMLLLLLLQ